MHSNTGSAMRAIVVALALGCANATSSAATKYHQIAVDHAGHAVAEFTTIRGVDQDPDSERVLYEDDSGRLVVIRDGMPTPTIWAISYACLATSETLELDIVFDESITIKLGSRSVRIEAADVDREATALPRGISAQVASMVKDLSGTCRDTLHRLAEIGTFYSFELAADAGEIGGLLFPDIPHRHPSGDDLIAPRRNVVSPFDPNQTPPDAFEQQFGNAYFQ